MSPIYKQDCGSQTNFLYTAIDKFIEAIKRHGTDFFGPRGFLYSDGTFIPLSTRGTNTHAEFAKDHILDDAGFQTWEKNNPVPAKSPNVNMLNLLLILWRDYKNEEALFAQSWFEKLFKETDVTPELLDQLLLVLFEGDIEYMYCIKYGAIRIWITDKTLIAEVPKWNSANLKVLNNFAFDNIESLTKFILSEFGEGKGEIVAQGTIWDLPNKLSDLVRHRRVAFFNSIIRKTI